MELTHVPQSQVDEVAKTTTVLSAIKVSDLFRQFADALDDPEKMVLVDTQGASEEVGSIAVAIRKIGNRIGIEWKEISNATQER